MTPFESEVLKVFMFQYQKRPGLFLVIFSWNFWKFNFGLISWGLKSLSARKLSVLVTDFNLSFENECTKKWIGPAWSNLFGLSVCQIFLKTNRYFNGNRSHKLWLWHKIITKLKLWINFSFLKKRYEKSLKLLFF